MSNHTLAIIKPDSVSKSNTGKIIDRILNGGFQILAMQQVMLTKERAGAFYAVHSERSFFNHLVDFMTSKPCVPIALKKEDAVTSFRKLIGATNPEEADEGTIRRDFAENIQNNAVHGSDSNENAVKEIAFFFSSLEISTD